MVGTGIAAKVLAFVLLPFGATAVALITERDSVVRREPSSVQVNAQGEMIEKSRQNSETIEVPVTCNIDFVEGPDRANNCTDMVGELADHPYEVIREKSQCKTAATMSGAGLSPNFDAELANTGFEYIRPKGCFKETCSGSTGTCYMYNGNGDWPNTANASFKGKPICSRPRNVHGTMDSHGTCPLGYQVIDHDATCRLVASCLGKTAGDVFDIGRYNASRHLDYPRGCFIDKEDGKVYFNPEHPLGQGTNVLGTPICNVSQTLQW